MEPKESVVGGEADIPSDNQNRPLLTRGRPPAGLPLRHWDSKL